MKRNRQPSSVTLKFIGGGYHRYVKYESAVGFVRVNAYRTLVTAEAGSPVLFCASFHLSHALWV